MKLETMSKNVVSVVWTLAHNPMLGRLLTTDFADPYDVEKYPAPDPKELMNPNSSDAKIFPYPFDADATTLDGSFIRVYYNDGDFNSNETIAEAQLHIDIIVSKDLWLIHNDRNESLIRPYDIMGRVIDLVGRRSIGKGAKIKFTGYQHLYVNTQFDCIRLTAEYMSVEA